MKSLQFYITNIYYISKIYIHSHNTCPILTKRMYLFLKKKKIIFSHLNEMLPIKKNLFLIGNLNHFKILP